MEIIIHEKDGQKIAQVVSNDIIISKTQDALDLMVDPALEGSRKIIAGDILQKFVQYQVKLAIVGDFSDASESLKEFIYESNKGQEIFFCATADEAKEKLFAVK
jgi:hypothetical protein